MDILENVEKVSVDGGSVVGIIAITLVAAVVFIFLGSVCLIGVRKLFHRIFDKEQ